MLTSNIYSDILFTEQTFTKEQSREVSTMKSNKKYRIKSKSRFITFLVIVICVFVGTIGYFTGFSTANAIEDSDYKIIEVSCGDTIWDLAEQYKDDNVEIRDAVYAICELNDIKADEIKPGMKLTIPVSM